MITLESTVTCPSCGAKHSETMPIHYCLVRYDCERCGAILKPKPSDCCVFCSFGSAPCPPVQQMARDQSEALTGCCAPSPNQDGC